MTGAAFMKLGLAAYDVKNVHGFSNHGNVPAWIIGVLGCYRVSLWLGLVGNSPDQLSTIIRNQHGTVQCHCHAHQSPIDILAGGIRHKSGEERCWISDRRGRCGRG